MESEESETPAVKKITNTLFNYFAKPLQASSNNELVGKKLDIKESGGKIENIPKSKGDDDKENAKTKSVSKVLKKKRKKRDASSSSEEDVPEKQTQKKKRVKKSQSKVPLDVETVVEARTDSPELVNRVEIGETSVQIDDEDEPITSSEAQPSKSISNFFTKVTKKERLSLVEKESSQLKVQVMIHDSPEVKSKVIKEVSEEIRTRKPRKSNVARSAVETEKINVLEVTEVKEVDTVVAESSEVEIELDSNMSSGEASEKISSKLFTLKRKSEKSKPLIDESDTSINMESLENTPVKDDSVKSPVKKSSKDEINIVKSAFSVLMGRKKESSRVGVENDDETNALEENDHSNEKSQDIEVLGEETKKGKITAPAMRVKKDLGQENNKSKEEVSEQNNAFSFLMAKKKPAEKAKEEDYDPIITEEKSVKALGYDLNGKLNKIVKPKISESNVPMKNNVFLTLMKNSRKSFEPPPEDEKGESGASSPLKIEVSKEVSEVHADEKLKNMLRALQAVESESDCVEVTESPKRKKRKGKKKSKMKNKSEKGEPLPVVSDVDGDVEIDIEVLDKTEDDVYEVKCRRAVGEFHMSKFVSGSKGECILYEGSWISPNEFEKEAGSRSKKYKNSLFVNNKPIIKLLEEKNISTPSRSNSRSERSTPVEEVDSSTPITTPKRNATKKKNIKRIIVSDDETIPEEETSENKVESQERRRGSGRIAKNLAALQEKRRQEEDLEKAEKEIKRKRKEEQKTRKEEERKAKKDAKVAQKAPKKRRPVSSSSESESDSDSDCQVEEVVVKSKKTGKLAAIFTGGKKVPVKPAEDPAVTAARRAFLMSSAPEVLKSQISEDKSDNIPDDGGVVWPGEGTLASHTQQREKEDLWSLKMVIQNLKHKSQELCVKTPEALPGQLKLDATQEVASKLTKDRLCEADVLATLDNWTKQGQVPVQKMFNSFVERKVEAESFEREAREKNLSVQEVEERRIRGNRRRSRRSREGKGDGGEGKYVIESGSGLMWTGKYQPRSVGDMVGNTEELSRMREWLRGWVGGRTRGGGSTSETGSEWGASEAGSEYETVTEGLNNTAVLEGEIGVGKSAAVYALAAEMGFNVLEVNASSCRTGRQVQR